MQGPSPEQVTRIITQSIRDALSLRPSPQRKSTDANPGVWSAQMGQLVFRGCEILRGQGYEPEIIESKERVDDYFEDLLDRVRDARLSDSLANNQNPRLQKVADALTDNSDKKPLRSPDIKDLVDKLRPPYGQLLGALHEVNMLNGMMLYHSQRAMLMQVFRPENFPGHSK